MTKTQQLNLHITKLIEEQVHLKLTCTWPTEQQEKCSKEWRRVVEVVGSVKGEGTKMKQTLSRKTKIKNEYKGREAEVKMCIYIVNMYNIIFHI